MIFPSTEATEAEIQIYGDVDAFAFDAQAGHIYRFSSGSLPMRLRGPNGEVLSDALGINDEVTQSGRYTLETYRYGDHLNRGLGRYSYKLEDIGLDDHGDTAEAATELVPGATGQGWIETYLDVDVFRFTAPAGRVVRFRCEIEKPTTNKCRIDLRDSAGTLLLENRQHEVEYEAGDTSVSLIAEVYAEPLGFYWYPRYTYRLEDLDP